ncbi:MAG: immune inhibitor A [Bryobacterales bacterium]|nr:immune inhibitor A [Bryobacterales bacterium]
MSARKLCGAGLGSPVPAALLVLSAFCTLPAKEGPSLSAVRAARLREATAAKSPRAAPLAAAPLTGRARVLVLLVEFTGPDRILYTPTGDEASRWDPIGKADAAEWAGQPGDCSNINKIHGIAAPREFTYQGPLHNRIERPRSAADASGSLIWTPDFSAAYYQAFLDGDGQALTYTRQDGSPVHADLRGRTVRAYFEEMSSGEFSVGADVAGWLQVPHSLMWYGADVCPGRNSSPELVEDAGAIPGAGSLRSLVQDALAAFLAERPDFDFTPFDQNADGAIDHLWIIHAGYGQEQGRTLLNRTEYGEGTLWSTSASVSPPVPLTGVLAVDHVLILPENTAAGTMVHEFAHALGAIDLYAYLGGDPAVGFWSVMSDNWVGAPALTEPPAFDPLHLEQFGWLQPLVISDPAQEYYVRLRAPTAAGPSAGAERGVKIELPRATAPLPVQPQGTRQWWSGHENFTNSTMTLAAPLTLAPGARLVFDVAYETEKNWDFLWTQISTDGGATWTTLTNEHTSCLTASGWAGPLFGFPPDLCAAGVAGFTGQSPGFPKYTTEAFDLTPFAGQDVQLRFWYMTDLALSLHGVFIDNVRIVAGEGETLWSDAAEDEDTKWTYAGAWRAVTGSIEYDHSYYLQFRNPQAGVDRGLSNSAWAPGPANSGLLIWYRDGRYVDNEITRYLADPPSFGPKGALLLVDAHPQPYRDPLRVAMGFDHAGANGSARYQIRDAPFGLRSTVKFRMQAWEGTTAVELGGEPGVPLFDDALGYYPGASYARLGFGYTPARWAWVANQWDASAVIPATKAYGMNAPGFEANAPVLYNCSADKVAGTLLCETFHSVDKPDASGGSGNPGETGGQYGWRVQVVEHNENDVLVKIWNSLTTDLPPTVALTAPDPAKPVSGTVNLAMTAADDRGLASVDLLVDGRALARYVAPLPAAIPWNTGTLANGPHRIALRVCDTARPVQCATAAQTYAVEERTAPVVTVKNPRSGSVVSGDVKIDYQTATASGTATQVVSLLVDGAPLQTANAAAGTFIWKSGSVAAGLHRVTVRAVNNAGRSGEAELLFDVTR